MIQQLTHGRVELALHKLKDTYAANAHPLLILHGLGQSSQSLMPANSHQNWPGRVFGLDFTGHGQSSIPLGGGYSAEALMGDVDVALRHIGASTIHGYGLGAYIALLMAGARPSLVKGAVLFDGPGLAGVAPTSAPYVPAIDTLRSSTTPDPFAIAEFSIDHRPPDHACLFANLASEHSSLTNPITISTHETPPWLCAVMNELSIKNEHNTNVSFLKYSNPLNLGTFHETK